MKPIQYNIKCDGSNTKVAKLKFLTVIEPTSKTCAEQRNCATINRTALYICMQYKSLKYKTLYSLRGEL